MPRGSLVALTLFLATPAIAAPPSEVVDEAMGRYLDELERSRRLPAESVSVESMRDILRAAEDRLMRGDARAATTLLYGVVESPRYSPWKDEAAYQNGELLLGRALLRGGAHVSAERYLLRVLGHGSAGPYFVPAFRALVDLALETRAYARIADRLAAVAGPASLPSDSASELAYLRGRDAYGHNELDRASASFAAVARTSRLYPGAAYFRGLVAARRRSWQEAKSAFCEIADQRDKGRLAFLIDGRYFALKDLARLALGRVSHEQDRYDDAYYHYFSIPEDSERLAEALFEAAWSMYSKGEIEAARAFADQFERLFPQSPLAPEVAILQANLDLKRCAFDGARARIAALTARYQPLSQEVRRAAGDPRRRRELLDRLMGREAAVGPAADLDGQILALLQLDDRFASLHRSIRDIDGDIRDAAAGVALWRALGEDARPGGRAVAAPSSPEAAQLLADVQALAMEAQDTTGISRRAAGLLLEVSLLAHPPQKAGPFAAEAQAAEAMGRRLAVLREQMVDAAAALAEHALRALDARLRSTLAQARLAQIDAVVGRKKKLEVEIANLNAGKLPADLFHRLQAEGAIGDDEEYWPFEGELWHDEYYGFK